MEYGGDRQDLQERPTSHRDLLVVVVGVVAHGVCIDSYEI